MDYNGISSHFPWFKFSLEMLNCLIWYSIYCSRRVRQWWWKFGHQKSWTDTWWVTNCNISIHIRYVTQGNGRSRLTTVKKDQVADSMQLQFGWTVQFQTAPHSALLISNTDSLRYDQTLPISQFLVLFMYFFHCLKWETQVLPTSSGCSKSSSRCCGVSPIWNCYCSILADFSIRTSISAEFTSKM